MESFLQSDMDTLTGDLEGDLEDELNRGGVNVRMELFPQSDTLAGDGGTTEGELGGVTEFRSPKSGLLVRSTNSGGPMGTSSRVKSMKWLLLIPKIKLFEILLFKVLRSIEL